MHWFSCQGPGIPAAAFSSYFQVINVKKLVVLKVLIVSFRQYIWGLSCFHPTCLKGYVCSLLKFLPSSYNRAPCCKLSYEANLRFSGLPHILKENIFWPNSDPIYVILKPYAAQPSKKRVHLMCLSRSLTPACIAVVQQKLVICGELIWGK